MPPKTDNRRRQRPTVCHRNAVLWDHRHSVKWRAPPAAYTSESVHGNQAVECASATAIGRDEEPTPRPTLARNPHGVYGTILDDRVAPPPYGDSVGKTNGVIV